MIVILEGPDGAGKSTLAKALQAEFPKSVLLHNGPQAGLSSTDLYNAYFTQLRKAAQQPVILDRCWVSENVYGPIHRGVSRLTPWQTQSLEAEALGLGALLIMCRPSFKKCLVAFESGREEMLKSRDALWDVYNTYESVKTGLPTVIYDYRLWPNKPEAFIKKIKEYKHATMA